MRELTYFDQEKKLWKIVWKILWTEKISFLLVSQEENTLNQVEFQIHDELHVLTLDIEATFQSF